MTVHRYYRGKLVSDLDSYNDYGVPKATIPQDTSYSMMSRDQMNEYYRLRAKKVHDSQLDGNTLLYCSFDVGGKCRHALATRQCFECVRFDPTGTGYYCEYCFLQRHPAYRQPHNFTFIKQEIPDKTTKKTVNVVLERTINSAVSLLNETRANEQALEDRIKEVKPKLSSAAAQCDNLLAEVTGLVLKLRDDNYNMRQLSARKIQRAFRERLRTRWFRAAQKILWGRMLDKDIGVYFYVNRATLMTRREVPAIFGHKVPPDFPPRIYPATLSTRIAAYTIQRFLRSIRARKNLAGIASRLWRVVFTSDGQLTYYNVLTKRSQLQKPWVLFGLDPKIYGAHQDDMAHSRAASVLQRAVRRYKAFKMFAETVLSVWEKVWDPNSRKWFYYNKKTGTSQWNRPFPRLLRNFEFPTIMDTNMTLDEAQRVVMGLFRLVAAKLIIRRKIRQWYRRVWDPEFQTYYYYNIKTDESSWYVPAIAKRHNVLIPEATPEEILESSSRAQTGARMDTVASQGAINAQHDRFEGNIHEVRASPGAENEPDHVPFFTARDETLADMDPSPNDARPINLRDAALLHWQKLQEWVRHAPDAQATVTIHDFVAHGTALWKKLEKVAPNSTTSHTKDLPFLNEPYLFPGNKPDFSDARLG